MSTLQMSVRKVVCLFVIILIFVFTKPWENKAHFKQIKSCNVWLRMILIYDFKCANGFWAKL
jgi:hypothetical protein